MVAVLEEKIGENVQTMILRFKSVFFLVVCLCLAGACSSNNTIVSSEQKVLVFSKTAGFRHDCIPDGIALIRQLGNDNGFVVEATTDQDDFTLENLQQYKAVIFNNTTGDVLTPEQETAFENYIRSGGGYVGIHAASDTEYDWEWYGKLAGAYFLDHPGMTDTFPGIQQGILKVQDTSNRITAHLPEFWTKRDEFYNFKSIQPGLNVLLTIDEESYRGGKNGAFHPMTWFREFDGGRSFYTALGHTRESYAEPEFQQLLLRGILYALGRDAISNQ